MNPRACARGLGTQPAWSSAQHAQTQMKLQQLASKSHLVLPRRPRRCFGATCTINTSLPLVRLARCCSWHSLVSAPALSRRLECHTPINNGSKLLKTICNSSALNPVTCCAGRGCPGSEGDTLSLHARLWRHAHQATHMCPCASPDRQDVLVAPLRLALRRHSVGDGRKVECSMPKSVFASLARHQRPEP